MIELSTLPAEQDPIVAERIPLGPSRRRILVTGGVVVAAAAATVACGSSTPEASSTPAASSDPAASPPAASAASTAMEAPTADIAVGGGVIYADKMVVVTQPTAGDFKAFSAVCTHKGCTVAKVADGLITCACHGSQFSIEDGSVTTGPASSPLPAVPITVEGDKVVVA